VKGSRASRSPALSDRAPGESTAERVERILATRGLTLSEVSRELRERYARTPHYLVPHNFYYDLGLAGYTPRIEQILALSRISNYRLTDWLAVFGLHLDDLPRLQAEFPSPRTSLLDHTAYDRAAWIGWFRDVTGRTDPPAVAPLGQLLTPAHPRRADSLVAAEASPFLYAKIGHEDAFAFPDLLPGSIVRADSRGTDELLRSMQSKNSERLFLVEHPQGFLCCRLHARSKGKVTLRASTLPFAQTELRLGSEGRILGVLDWELRPFNFLRPEVPTASMKFLTPQALTVAGTEPGLRGLLKRARFRSGLSIRSASAKSRWIAEALRDKRYFCAPGSLTGFETRPRLPVHIHKILSVCVLYSLGFWELLAVAGLDTGDSGHEPIPDELIGRRTPDFPPTANEAAAGNNKQQGFLSSLVARFEEIPLFLRHSLPAITGLPGLSLRDLFWTGGRIASLHPYLQDALLVSVNRRLKKPVFLKRNSLWEQPLYILLLRDGRYLLAGCSVEGRTLVVHPFADGFSRPQMFQHGVDAEMVGKVTALFRRLR
jgi:hypothetical protein